MKKYNVILVFASILWFFPDAAAVAQSREARQIDAYVRGYTFLNTYRDGGPIYGWHYQEYSYFCRSGAYAKVVRGSRRTILGNTEYRNWEEYGRWEVVSRQGKVYMDIYLNTRGRFQAIVRRSGGGLWAGDTRGNAVTLQRMQRAQCPG